MKTAIRVGWLAGIAVIMAGFPLPLAVAAPLLAGAGAFAWLRWGHGTWLGLKVAVQLRRKLRQAAKTGGTLERA